MNLSTDREDNSDLISKLSSVMESNLSLQQENKDLKRSLENLQKKYKTNISELEQTIDSLRNQNLAQTEFSFEKAQEEKNNPINSTKHAQIIAANRPNNANKENVESLLSRRLKSIEKENQRLQKLLADQKAKEAIQIQNDKNIDSQDESKYFSQLKSENERLKKLIDQKDLELTKAETTIAEKELEIAKLTHLQNEKIESIPIENIQNSDINNQDIENALETFEHIFEDEIARISELSDQRNRLFDIIKKFEKISLLESSIKSKNEEELKAEQIKKIENEAKEKALENLFKRITTAIQIKNNNFDDLFDDDDEYSSYEDKIIQLFQSISSQKETNENSNSNQIQRNVTFSEHNDLSETDENDKSSSIENLNNADILLGQLKNSCDFIRSFLKSKSFDQNSVIEKCAEIESFLKQQKPTPKIVTLFTNEPSISEQMKTFIQIRNNSKQKIESLTSKSKSNNANLEEISNEYKEMIKILYNLFKAVLTVNSLLFENIQELAKMYQKVSSEKDSLQIKNEMIEKNCEERLSYISSKLSNFLLKVKSNSPSAQTTNQEEESKKPISPDFIEEGIEKLCQQNIDLKMTLKEKNAQIKKMKQNTNKIVETRKIDHTENNENRKKVAKLEQQLAKVNLKYKQMKEKDDELISQLKVELDEALVALKNGDRLEKELEEQKAKVTKMKEKKENYDKLHNQIRELTSENNELKSQLKAAETQIQRLTANVESSSSQIENLTEKVRKMKDKKNLLKKENEQLLNKNRTEIAELRDRNIKLENDMKNSFESLTTENNQLKEKIEQMTNEMQNIEELKNATAQKVAQANLKSKNANLQLLECQNALKVNKDVAEQQIYSMKTSFELDLKKLRDEIERCRKRFIYAFQIDNINIHKYLSKGINDVSQVPLFDLINAFISFYNPQKIIDYDKCLNFFKMNSNEKSDKSNLPLYGRCKSVMKNLSEMNNDLNSKKKELNHVSLEIDDLCHQLNQNKNDSNAYKALKKRLISLYTKMKKGQVPQNSPNSNDMRYNLALNCNANFELDSKEFDKVLNEIEEMIYINFLKPGCLQFKLDLMRAEKLILSDERIRKLVSIESSGDVINNGQRNIEKIRSLRPISIVILFARRVCELSGFSHFYYVQKNTKK